MDVKGDKDKWCNQIKAGGDGHVEEKKCSGNPALVVCGGESLASILILQRIELFSCISRFTLVKAVMARDHSRLMMSMPQL